MAADDHLTKMVAHACGGISREMWGRIEGEISDKDALAITAALTKTATASVRLAVVEVTAQLTEADASIGVSLDASDEERDGWAERYGERP